MSHKMPQDGAIENIALVAYNTSKKIILSVQILTRIELLREILKMNVIGVFQYDRSCHFQDVYLSSSNAGATNWCFYNFGNF